MLEVIAQLCGGIGYEFVWLYGYGGDDETDGDADGCA